MSTKPEKIERLVLSIATNQFKVPLPTGKEVVDAVNERDGLLAERNRLREALEALEPLVTRVENMMMNGPECDCPAEGHMCGWPDLQREASIARAALSGKKEGEGNG